MPVQQNVRPWNGLDMDRKISDLHTALVLMMVVEMEDETGTRDLTGCKTIRRQQHGEFQVIDVCEVEVGMFGKGVVEGWSLT